MLAFSSFSFHLYLSHSISTSQTKKEQEYISSERQWNMSHISHMATSAQSAASKGTAPSVVTESQKG